MTKRFAWAVLGTLLAVQSARAENWPQWRGPAFNGTSTETGLPDKLDPESTLVWKFPMPGQGASTPAIWEDRLFVTATDKQSLKLLAICLNTKTGEVIWQREVGQGGNPNARGNSTSTPSPITDGKTVWFYFGSGELVAFDMEGKPLWERNIAKEYGPFYIKWTYASSPLLYNGQLFVQVLHRDVPANGPVTAGAPPAESYLLAIDPATGKNLYKHVRPNKARLETKESYATPIPYEGAGRKEVILIGGDCVTGHDPATGEELWRYGGWTPPNNASYRVVATPIGMGDKLLVCSPQPMGVTIAIKMGGSGDVTASHKAWQINDIKSDVPCPFIYDKDLFIFDGDFKKGLSRMNPETGERKWFTSITSAPVFRASPLAADGKVYVMNDEAAVWVLSAADGKVLSNSSLATEGGARGAIVASQGKVFVRTGSMLYCFGSK